MNQRAWRLVGARIRSIAVANTLAGSSDECRFFGIKIPSGGLAPASSRRERRVISSVPAASFGFEVCALLPQHGKRCLIDHRRRPLFPSLAITILMLSLKLVGDWLRDMLDPRLRGYV